MLQLHLNSEFVTLYKYNKTYSYSVSRNCCEYRLSLQSKGIRMFKIIGFLGMSVLGAGSLYMMDQYNPSWKICKEYNEEESGIFNNEYTWVSYYMMSLS